MSHETQHSQAPERVSAEEVYTIADREVQQSYVGTRTTLSAAAVRT